MSCGMIHQDTYFSTSNWISKNEGKLSDSSSRIDLMTQLGSHYPSLIAEPQMSNEDLQNQMNSCYTCGVSWSDNHVSLDCRECGCYALERPCPMCDGKCHSKWRRDLQMTHSMGKAHWEGECSLPQDQRPAIPSFLAEDVLIQGLEDLTTSS